MLQGACGALAVTIPPRAVGTIEAALSRITLEVGLLAGQVPTPDGVGAVVVAARLVTCPRTLLAAVEATPETQGGLATAVIPVP